MSYFYVYMNILYEPFFIDNAVRLLFMKHVRLWCVCYNKLRPTYLLSEYHVVQRSNLILNKLATNIAKMLFCDRLILTQSLWLGSRVVSVLDPGAENRGFKSQSRRCRVTVLGKLFTPIVPLFTKQENW